MAELKKTIGVFFGGKSPEHDISIITGALAISELRKMPEYEVVPVYLDKAEKFYLGAELGRLGFFAEENYQEKLKEFSGYDLDLDASDGCLIFVKAGRFSRKEIKIDLAFPAFHGNLGEDGSIQGLFNIFNIPFIGCDVAASAVAMDKILVKLFYQALNIPTTKFLSYQRAEWESNKVAILTSARESLTWPVFVKPPHLGSSIGIAKVKKFEELEQAIEVVLHYDDKILIEESVENMVDITCAVRGYKNPQASLLQESIFSADLFSYEDKYLNDGGAQLGRAEQQLIIPANLSSEITARIQADSRRIFSALGCSGIARFDYLYNKVTGQYFANEINPLPGTLYHHLWQKSGVSLNQLIRDLLADALLVHSEKQKTVHTFSSEVLKQVKGLKLRKK